MYVGVQIAIIATPVPLLAIVRDIWVRKRVEVQAAQDRLDRLEKERLDRAQAADIAVVATVPAFLALGEETQMRELAALKDKCRILEAKVKELTRKENAHRREDHDRTK